MATIDRAKLALLPGLPVDEVLACYARSPGDELSSKFSSPESSAALAANLFGFFIQRPADFPRLPAVAGPWKPVRVEPEVELRFPWQGGRHPWLDAVIETETHLIGVESKRYEPFRSRKVGTFSDAYSRDVWGRRMEPYKWLRDGLRARPALFRHLDAVQLIKHAFGIRTQANATKPAKVPVLVYLSAQPRAWPGGKTISVDEHEAHAEEVRCFARLVGGAEVSFIALTYRELLQGMATAKAGEVRDHAAAVEHRFGDFG